MKTKVLNFLKEYKWLIGTSIILLGILIFTTMNTTLASDDYPYSLFYRGGARITHLSQIIVNQLSDYMKINGRIFTNGLGQLLLMFDRPVFALCNSVVILITLLLIIKLVDLYHPIQKKTWSILLILGFGLFIMMDSMKYIIYWVMGAANYVWILPCILLFLLYTKKNGLWKHPILQAFYVAIVSCFHESLLVFFIIFIVFHIFYDIWKKKPFDKRYFYYFLALIFAATFIFASPGNRLRNATWYPEWNKLNLFERLMMSIPVVAKNMFGFDNIHNLIPLIFAVFIICTLLKKKEKLAYLLSASLVCFYLLGLFFQNGWCYLLFSIILFLSEFYIHETSKNQDLSLVSVSFYAVVYSMILTPEYAAGRPNYFMYGYMIFAILYFIQPYLNKKIVITGLSILACIFIVRECYIYQIIGDVIEKRELAIEKVKRENLEVLEFEKIKTGFGRYHMEPNTPAEEGYWAKQYFCTYYGLPKDITIKLVESKK